MGGCGNDVPFFGPWPVVDAGLDAGDTSDFRDGAHPADAFSEPDTTPPPAGIDADQDGVDVNFDPDDNDPLTCGDSDADSCDDCAIRGTFSPNDDGYDRDGDGRCELPLDYDCMNGANAASDPNRTAACAMMTLVNQDRARFVEESGNAGPVAWNEDIWEVAIRHSIDMCERGYFEHDNPDGLGPSDRARAGGLSYGLSENISLNFEPEAAQYGFMEEPTCIGHRRGVLDPTAVEVGIGYHICNNPAYAEWGQHHHVTQNYRSDFSIRDTSFCSDPSAACQVPPTPPTTALCGEPYVGWGFCPPPSAETLVGWDCE